LLASRSRLLASAPLSFCENLDRTKRPRSPTEGSAIQAAANDSTDLADRWRPKINRGRVSVEMQAMLECSSPRAQRLPCRRRQKPCAGEWVSKRKSQFGSELTFQRREKVSSVPNSLFFLQRATWRPAPAAATGWNRCMGFSRDARLLEVPSRMGLGIACGSNDVRGGPAPPQQLLRFRLRIGSQRCVES
jgi:hypothetical protein